MFIAGAKRQTVTSEDELLFVTQVSLQPFQESNCLEFILSEH